MAKGNKWADHYTSRAKNEKWLARSIYKLEEIDKKNRIIRKNDHVLDLGCYPGSWSQYSLKKVGPSGEVVGIDLKKPDLLSASNFKYIEADILSLDIQWLKKEIGHRNVVLSDMAPKTTGIRISDTAQSLALAERALEIAIVTLQKNGHFVCKVFEGEGFKTFRNQTSKHFNQTKIIRPSAVRKSSREVFFLGLTFIN